MIEEFLFDIKLFFRVFLHGNQWMHTIVKSDREVGVSIYEKEKERTYLRLLVLNGYLTLPPSQQSKVGQQYHAILNMDKISIS